MTKKKQVAFRITETANQYIEEYADRNNLKKVQSLERIIREHAENNEEHLYVMAEVFSEKFKNTYMDFFKEINNSAKETNRNVLVMIEILNSIILNMEIDTPFSTDFYECDTLHRCRDEVDYLLKRR